MTKLCVAALAAGLCAGLAACGGGKDVTPTIIPGGGVHDPGIDGEVNVYVIDDGTDAPIADATVRVGTIEGRTDATGLFVASGDKVTGKQTIVAKATNYAPSVWVGVDGANVTMTLTKATTTTPVVPQAELGGTITDFASIQPLVAGHFVAALVTYSQSKDLNADAANNLQPPPSGTQLPSNACIKPPTGTVPPCDWRINARAGTIAVAAIIYDLDPMGPGSQDDVLTPIKFAVKRPITVVDGANQTGLALDVLTEATTSASVTFGTPPAGYDAAGIVGVDLGDEGVLRLGNVSPTKTNVVMPSLSSFGGSTYELVGFAQEHGVTDGTDGQTIVLRRGITSASGIATGEWLAPPTGLASDRMTVSFTPATGSPATIVEIDTVPTSGVGVGNRAMSVAVLDGSTTVALPVDFAPLPSGSLLVKASGFDAGPDFRTDDFEVDTFQDVIQRLAAEAIKLN